MRAHSFVTVILSAFVLVNHWTVSAQDASAAKKPNVLFIAVDDLRTELGCYGEQAIHSPNIDWLAGSGVLFNRAYCQLAVCNPSRVSIMTGLRPDSTRVWDLRTRFRRTIPDAVTIPQHLIKHGYHAVSFGKIFHNPWPDNQSWSEPHAWPESSRLWSDGARERLKEYRDKMRAQGRSENQLQRLRAAATEIIDIPDHEHIDGAIAEQGLAAIQRLARQDKPFFLAVGFVRPHLPFVVPRKYWQMYRRESIPLASNSFLPTRAPEFAMNTMYELRDYWDFDGTPRPDEGSLSEAQQRRLKHGYYASVSMIDHLVGRLLEKLDAEGLAKNTIVVLWSDHGWKLGEHNSWCKQTNYEIDARVPLIIRAPGAKANGQSTDALVELVDVYPTLCELAGLPVPNQLEGKSVAPLLSDTNANWKKAAFSQFRREYQGAPLMGYAMRTDRYRYIEWQDRRTREVVARELYDHQSDRQENRNIADASDNTELVAALSGQMWSTLPAPPKYAPPKKKSLSQHGLPAKAGETNRPQVTFVNLSAAPLTLFWINPDGQNVKSGMIAPGGQSRRNTTVGHRFRIRGPDGFEQTFQVARDGERFVIKIKSTEEKLGQQGSDLPNIVVCLADDWSWPHASIIGDPIVSTPNFDRIAKQGVLFEHAFVSTPSCTPSRLSLLTGQHHWRLQEGDSLGGSLREEYEVYTEMLEQAGYAIGRFGKGVWPSKHLFRNRDSFGPRFDSLEEFLQQRSPGQPFCYLHGGQDPHRPYEMGIGKRSGMNLDNIRVPACLPDNEIVRGDIADYLWEVQRFDRQVGQILARLEAVGELENTILVVSSDNGMPFPRCKATLFDQGTRVPLAIRWGSKVAGNRTISDFVSLCDLAPTFLEAAGIEVPAEMTGRSLLPALLSNQSGQIDARRSFVLTGAEKHVYRYPRRAYRTKDFLYIRNFDPESWERGEVPGKNPIFDFSANPWPTEPGAFSFAIDPSPTKQFLRLNRDAPDVKAIADLSFSVRPEHELYDLRRDPQQVNNVADDPAYAVTLKRLRQQLRRRLIEGGDPRFLKQGPEDDLCCRSLKPIQDQSHDILGTSPGQREPRTAMSIVVYQATIIINGH